MELWEVDDYLLSVCWTNGCLFMIMVFFHLGEQPNPRYYSNASIFMSMACFHFLSLNASDKQVGVVVLFRLVRKALWVGEKFLKDR